MTASVRNVRLRVNEKAELRHPISFVCSLGEAILNSEHMFQREPDRQAIGQKPGLL